MALLMAIIIGCVVGIIVGRWLRRSEITPVAMVLGVAGAVIGDAIYCFASGELTLLFTWAGFFSQLLGALVFVFIFGMLHRATLKAADTLQDR